jgi:hypothetical protein
MVGFSLAWDAFTKPNDTPGGLRIVTVKNRSYSVRRTTGQKVYTELKLVCGLGFMVVQGSRCMVYGLRFEFYGKGSRIEVPWWRAAHPPFDIWILIFDIFKGGSQPLNDDSGV